MASTPEELIELQEVGRSGAFMAGLSRCCAQEEFQQERQRLIEEIALMAQDAAMNFTTLNDNLDRLLSMVSSDRRSPVLAGDLTEQRADPSDFDQQADLGCPGSGHVPVFR
jgi:hypothetical protein